MVFYTLHEAFATQFIRAYLDHYPPEADNGMRGFSGVITGGVDRGKRPGDVVGTTCALDLYSEHFVQILRDHSFRSFETCPARIRADGGDLPPYYAIAVTGKPVHILPEESDIVWGQPRPDGARWMMLVKSAVLDETEWDGSDIFWVAELRRALIVTEPVAKALSAAKVTNLRAEPLGEFRF